MHILGSLACDGECSLEDIELSRVWSSISQSKTGNHGWVEKMNVVMCVCTGEDECGHMCMCTEDERGHMCVSAQEAGGTERADGDDNRCHLLCGIWGETCLSGWEIRTQGVCFLDTCHQKDTFLSAPGWDHGALTPFPSFSVWSSWEWCSLEANNSKHLIPSAASQGLVPGTTKAVDIWDQAVPGLSVPSEKHAGR